jgi:hypothetical protein
MSAEGLRGRNPTSHALPAGAPRAGALRGEALPIAAGETPAGPVRAKPAVV